MKFLTHIRSKSRIKTPPPAEATIYSSRLHPSLPSRYDPPRSHRASYSSTVAARLPTPILAKIFSYVCPHVLDTSYLPLEDSTLSASDSATPLSSLEDVCCLCALRDLAHCAAACRGWHITARDLLYRSIRIDPVHYCDLENVLAEQRKHSSFFNRNAEPRDAPMARLQLFSRSVRDKPEVLGVLVEYLKMPYMTRETCRADLARIVSVLPSLRYVDLPEGFYSDDPGSLTLRQELRARCGEIRRMKYCAGGEGSFALLAGLGMGGENVGGGHWAGLEVLEIHGLNVEPQTFLRVLGRLRCLRELQLSDLPWFDDSIFTPPQHGSPQQAFSPFPMAHPIAGGHMSVMPPSGPLPAFPPLTRLALRNIPSLTSAGLINYFSTYPAPPIDTLTLQQTGIHPQHLHHFLSLVPTLTHLSLVETITRSFPTDPIPPLASSSLVTLHYEIMAPTSSSSLIPASYGSTPVSLTQGYYTYLSSSLHAAALPSLRQLYVRDASFPEHLIFVPPVAPFAAAAATSQPAGFQQQLEVYSKGLDELEWQFTHVSPSDGPGERGSSLQIRPTSSYSAGGSPGFGPPGGFGGGAGERRSVMVGNGFGAFLAVPDPNAQAADDVRHNTEGGWPSPNLSGKRAARSDPWR